MGSPERIMRLLFCRAFDEGKVGFLSSMLRVVAYCVHGFLGTGSRGTLCV